MNESRIEHVPWTDVAKIYIIKRIKTTEKTRMFYSQEKRNRFSLQHALNGPAGNASSSKTINKNKNRKRFTTYINDAFLVLYVSHTSYARDTTRIIITIK